MENKKEILINKIGLREEVADFILMLTDKHHIWIANQIKKQPSLFYTKKEELLRIIEWKKTDEKFSLKDLDFKQAYKIAKEQIQKADLKHHELIKNSFINVDGLYWVKLKSVAEFIEEGKEMRHCLNGSDFHNKYIYSLRNKKGKSFVTLDINKRTGDICYIVGSCNTIIKDSFVNSLALFLDKNNEWENIRSGESKFKVLKFAIENKMYNLVKKIQK